MKIGKHFTLAELTRTSVRGDNTPPPAARASLEALVTHVLDPLREMLNAPIVVSSGYRSSRVNAAVGGSPTSQHVLGEAVDFTVPGVSTDAIVRRIAASSLPFDQVIEEFGRWVHVSYGPRHRRQALRATKVAGRTHYGTFK